MHYLLLWISQPSRVAPFDLAFLLSPPQRVPSAIELPASVSPAHGPNLYNRATVGNAKAFKQQLPVAPDVERGLASMSVELPSTTLPDIPSFWTTASPIELSDDELQIVQRLRTKFELLIGLLRSS
ncbi:hypothetical protein V1523DRAFT_425507 [Lipomyces doorenjongii]